MIVAKLSAVMVCSHAWSVMLPWCCHTCSCLESLLVTAQECLSARSLKGQFSEVEWSAHAHGFSSLNAIPKNQIWDLEKSCPCSDFRVNYIEIDFSASVTACCYSLRCSQTALRPSQVDLHFLRPWNSNDQHQVTRGQSSASFGSRVPLPTGADGLSAYRPYVFDTRSTADQSTLAALPRAPT